VQLPHNALPASNSQPTSTPSASIPQPETQRQNESLHQPADSRVSRQSDLVDAPSIGPKTARRFEKLGITTIGQFLDADAATVCTNLEVRWITKDLIEEWQDQAQLVCDVPALCGYKAQLLVATGIRDSNALARSVPSALHQKIAHVCRGIDGQRILRSSPPPSSADVGEWISSALDSQARAA
jgi:predicted flap endonuclease-1-like 5' DNA nuclease